MKKVVTQKKSAKIYEKKVEGEIMMHNTFPQLNSATAARE